jgi:hypothetical protein
MSETVKETAARLASFIGETYADADVSPGSVINELVVKLAAAVQNEQYNEISSISQTRSVAQALSSTEDTYSPVIDLVASNFNASRSQGKKSTGKLKVTVSAQNNYNLPREFTFIQPALGLKYTLENDTRISPEPDTEIGELPLYTRGNTYYFILPVIAAAVGSEYQVSSGTVFSTASPFDIADFVKAEAYGNFTTGLPADTDKELIGKFKSNLGSRRLESPAGISNRLKELYPTFQALSVCGANDPEMTRSKQNALGIATFGKADVYIRTTTGLEIFEAVVSATKVGSGVWEAVLDNTFCPGFYRVISILPNQEIANLGGTLLVQSVEYGRLTFEDRNNELYSALDARFSKYQKATVRFLYDEAPAVSLGEARDFKVAVSYQPYVGEIQDLLLSSDERLICADYLIRAALPCLVSLDIGLVRKKSTDTYDSLGLNKLKQDIFNYINTIPFGADLHASKIVDICHNYDISRVDLPIQLTGNILCNDGSSITITDNDFLSIPTNIQKGISKKTTQFFIDYYRQDLASSSVVDSIGLRLI